MTKTFRVMLFEDTPDDELLALRALKASGAPLEVRVARDGLEALGILGLTDQPNDGEEPLPSLIISDLKMPKLTGPEILALARRDRRLDDVPFVIFSSSDDEDDIERCMALGATAYCVKPVDYTEYVKCVKAIADKWLLQDDRAEPIECALEMATGTR